MLRWHSYGGARLASPTSPQRTFAKPTNYVIVQVTKKVFFLTAYYDGRGTGNQEKVPKGGQVWRGPRAGHVRRCFPGAVPGK